MYGTPSYGHFMYIVYFTGQAHSRAELIRGIENVNTAKGGPQLEKFLKEAQCYRTAVQMRRAGSSKNFPCETIAKYESSKFIIWNGIQLTTTGSPLGKLSQIKTRYLNSIKEEINALFPENRSGSSMSDLGIFDHRRFSGYTDAIIKSKFKLASKFLGYSNVPTTYVNEYLALVKQIKADPIDLCDKSQSSPRLAWSVSTFVHTYILSQMYNLVKRAQEPIFREVQSSASAHAGGLRSSSPVKNRFLVHFYLGFGVVLNIFNIFYFRFS